MSHCVRAESDGELTDAERKRLSEDFDYIRFTVCDINGIGRCKAVPRRHISSTLVRGGVDIYSGVLGLGPRGQIVPQDEVVEINNGNAVLVPMSGTLHSLPWATDGTYKVCDVLCETFWISPYKGGTAQSVCPRNVARRQLQKLDDLGYTILSGFEPEFTAFRRGTMEPIFRGSDIFSCRDLAEFESYMYYLDSGLVEAGADCGTLNTEYASGQFEFPTTPRFGIEAADMMFRLKHVVKEMSLKKDVEVTFMTQPILKAFNNGLHFSHSLWKNEGKTNAFHHITTNDNKSNPGVHMSDTLNHWLAGLLRHTPALVALCCPTVNCYRRLGTPWAPGAADWGINDRYRAFRVKSGPDIQMESYVENRIPSGPANPYLILAATIAAGISGLQDPDSKLPPAQTEAGPLPKSLEEALEALEKDRVIVEALGEEFIRWFCKIKWEMEVKALKDAEFDKELEMYFKMF